MTVHSAASHWSPSLGSSTSVRQRLIADEAKVEIVSNDKTDVVERLGAGASDVGAALDEVLLAEQGDVLGHVGLWLGVPVDVSNGDFGV